MQYKFYYNKETKLIYIFTSCKCLCSSGNLDCFNEMETLFSCKFTAMMTPEHKETQGVMLNIRVGLLPEAREYLKE